MKKKQVRNPIQKRSKEKRNRIIAATRKLFNDIGYKETTTHKIAEEAGVSVGSLYSYFRNKRDILVVIMEGFLNRIFLQHQSSFEEALTRSKNLEEAVELVIMRYVEMLEDEKRLHKEIFLQAYQDPELRDLYFDNNTMVEFIVEKLKTAYGDRVEVDDIQAAAFLLRHGAGAAINFLVQFGSAGSQETILREIKKMIYRYFRKEDS